MPDAGDVGMEKSQLKKLLSLSKKDPVSCAVGLNSGQAVILLEKSSLKKAMALGRDLKEQFPNVKNARWGTATVKAATDPKLVILTLNKAVSGMARSLKKSLRGTGYTKVQIHLEDGSVAESDMEDEEGEDEPAPTEGGRAAASAAGGGADAATSPAGEAGAAAASSDEDDDEDEEEPGASAGGAGAAADGDKDAPASPAGDAGTGPAQPARRELTGRLTELAKQAAAVIASDPARKAQLGPVATQAQEALRSNDPAAIAAAIKQMEAALAAGAGPSGASGPSGGTGPSGPGGADASADAEAPGAPSRSDSSDASPGAEPSGPPLDLAAAAAFWQDTLKAAASSIDTLKDTIRKEFADEAADVIKDIENNLGRLDRIIERLGEELAGALEAAAEAAEEEEARDEAARKAQITKVRAILAKLIKYVTSENLFDLIDNNPFVKAPDLKKKLMKNLTKLAADVR